MPGDVVGTFQVTGVLQESSCGPGALGAPNPWKFEIKLSRQDSYLYWYNGLEAVSGSLSSDGAFSFQSGVQATITEPAKGKPGCVLTRTDDLTGRLDVAGDDVSGFTGVMRYKYKAEAGSECLTAVASEGITALPCSMTYALTASRSR